MTAMQDNTQTLPEEAGIYIIRDADIPSVTLYVGISKNLRSRLTPQHHIIEHCRAWDINYTIDYELEPDSKKRERREHQLISELNATLNDGIDREPAKVSQTKQDSPDKEDKPSVSTLSGVPDLEDDERLGNWLKNAHRTSEEARAAIGRVLKEKRDLLNSQGKASDNSWYKWVEKHCSFSIKTANRYIRAAFPNKELSEKEAQSKAQQSISAKVTFSDQQLGKSYLMLKEYSPAKQELKDEMEAAARKVIEKYETEANRDGLELGEYIQVLKYRKYVEQS